jgi:hypothetical protein
MQIKFFKFKKEKSFKKEKESIWLDINLYWEFAVVFLIIGTLAYFIFGYYLFTGINKEFIAPIAPSTGQSATVNKDRIDKVLLFFSQREQASTQILNSSSPVVDPSL